MGYVVDRWHLSTPPKGAAECGEHKGKVAAKAHGKGKRWQARYNGPDGAERTSLHRTKPEAEKEITKQEASKLDGSWIDPDRGKTKIERVVFDIWLPATNTIERTKREYRGTMNRYLIPEWAGREVRSIRPSEAGAWQNLLTSKYELGGTTPNRVSRLVRSVFRMAVIDRMIPVSPFDGIKAPALVEAHIDPPDVSTVRLIIKEAHRDRWAVMAQLDALTGMRSGEIRGLRVDNLRLLNQALDVHQQLVYEPGKGYYLDKLKTGAGRRTLPLNKAAIKLLAWYLSKYPPPKEGEWAGLVFTMPGGKPIGESTLDWAFKAMCTKAKARRYRWHDLRHHYASVLIAGGENPKVVSRRLGHTDVAFTMRIYAHLFAEAEEQTRSVLDAAWAEPDETGGSGSESSEPTGTNPEPAPRERALVQVNP
ncbi:site-specific integrase [Streptomyces sp. ID05-04B]|uniref:tyrosine-type recombinase/integrase n=1 Tax=Streptomyces sp. ID05-04B TaxID=3028661 RepID=UPI0029C346FE|nr:site-specific integrase [Streptomyces sp. ID05-04B]MDX5570397.1 site-specific integrase [Streptomyces sp. ID05-04B]